MTPEKPLSKKEASQNMIGKTVYVMDDGVGREGWLTLSMRKILRC